MGKKTEDYVDTSALIALTDRSDSYHALFSQLFADPPALITTSLVIAEGHAWFLRRYDRIKALQFISMIEQMTPLEIVSVGHEEQNGAFVLLRKLADQNLTLTDAIGLYIIQSRRLKRCWSTDFHLRLTGAQLVIDE